MGNILQQVTYLEILADNSGQRIDNFLRTHLKGVPKSLVYRILRKGEIRVNKGRVKPCYRLLEGDCLRIPPLRKPSLDQSVSNISNPKLARIIADRVLYEDDSLIILNKPSGLAVHGGSGIQLGLIELMRLMRPNQKKLELVHRLDRDTSGCIMIAKKRSMLIEMHKLLRHRQGVKKTYHALMRGHTSPHFSVQAPLKRFELQSGERRVHVHPEGQESLTGFSLLERYPQFSLMEALPVTGRTHQIRVHAAYKGHPIAGDEKYGCRDSNIVMQAKGLDRLFLHARQLVFESPLSKELIAVQAPYDDVLTKSLGCLACKNTLGIGER